MRILFSFFKLKSDAPNFVEISFVKDLYQVVLLSSAYLPRILRNFKKELRKKYLECI